jgi:hypothetical protein
MLPAMTGRRIVRFERGDEIAERTRDADGDSVYHRSVQLAQTLIDHDLVDEPCVMVFPADRERAD